MKNAGILAEQLMDKGFRLVTNGTDTHLLIVDLTGWGIDGLEAEKRLDSAGITVNRPAIPFEKQASEMNASGIRIGTSALTTRGMKEKQMEQISRLILQVLRKPRDNSSVKSVRKEARHLANAFPIFSKEWLT